MVTLKNEENKYYKKQNLCHIDQKVLGTDDGNKRYYKVRDHSHYAGKYREGARNICNLR